MIPKGLTNILSITTRYFPPPTCGLGVIGAGVGVLGPGVGAGVLVHTCGLGVIGAGVGVLGPGVGAGVLVGAGVGT